MKNKKWKLSRKYFDLFFVSFKLLFSEPPIFCVTELSKSFRASAIAKLKLEDNAFKLLLVYITEYK